MKIWILFMAILFAFSLILACGSGDDDDDNARDDDTDDDVDDDTGDDDTTVNFACDENICTDSCPA